MPDWAQVSLSILGVLTLITVWPAFLAMWLEDRLPETRPGRLALCAGMLGLWPPVLAWLAGKWIWSGK